MNLAKVLHLQSAVLGCRALIVAAFMLYLAPFTAVRAADATQPFCIPQVVNVPGPNWLQPPTIDGVVSGDLGWTSARQHVFVNGTPVFDVEIQALRDASFLYFSFEVNNDTQFDATDAIYLGFDPTGAVGDRHLLRINPVIPSGLASPIAINYWHGYPWTGAGEIQPAGTVT